MTIILLDFYIIKYIIFNKKGLSMKKNINILNLYRKIICSFVCIMKNTKNHSLKIKASKYLDNFLKQYELYNNKGICTLNNTEKIINFCNECYEDKDIFDYAEDIEYGLKELIEIINK